MENNCPNKPCENCSESNKDFCTGIKLSMKEYKRNKSARKRKQKLRISIIEQSRLKNKGSNKSSTRKKKKPTFKYESLSVLKTMTYKQFLKSLYWEYVRQLVLIRDNDKCVTCGSDIKLHIHHITYEHHFSEHEHLDDLITLCNKCHKKKYLKL